MALASVEGACANSSDSFAFSFLSLLSISKEQLDTLGDEELCLFNNHVRRVYDRRMAKKHGSKPGCFECGDLGHFITDCPKRNVYYQKGGDSGSHNSGGPFKSNNYNKGLPEGSEASREGLHGKG